jgi:hypothetical protein
VGSTRRVVRIDDRKAWRTANPNLAEGLLDPDDLAVAVKQTSEMGMRRWRLNQWVRSQESWLPVGAWEQCVSNAELVSDLPVWVGIDMALKHDSIGVVVAQPQDDRTVVRSKIWQPSLEGVDVAEVEVYLRELHRTYQVQEFAFDPAYFYAKRRSVNLMTGYRWWSSGSQQQRMIPACGNAYEMIVNKKVAHDGSPTFTDQVLSAAQRMTDTGWRLSER